MDVQKETVMETIIKKPKMGKRTGVKCNLYEARSSEQQSFNPNAISDMKENLKRSNPKIPIVDGLRNSISTDSWCETKFGKVPIFSPLAYQCSKLGNNFNVYINIDRSPSNPSATPSTYPNFPHRSIPQYYHHDLSTLDSSQKAVFDKLQVTNDQAVILEQATQLQSQSSLWFSERKCRVTASKIYDVFHWKRGMERPTQHYQIQCQLALTGVKFCDLIVYTFRSIAIIRITFDTQFWSNVTDVVGTRYFKYILPQLI
jgi:hypothetical protein